VRFNVGDIVTMSLVCLEKIEGDEYEAEHNPVGELGAITSIEDRWGYVEYWVRWESGETNSYLEEDLELYVVYEPYTDSDLEEMIG